MEFIEYKNLRVNNMLYKGFTQQKRGVTYEGCKFMLREPSESDLINKHMLTSGVCNYIFSEVAKLYDLNTEHVTLVRKDSGDIISMSRDFEESTSSRFYSLLDILGMYNVLSGATDIMDIINVCKMFDHDNRLYGDSLCNLLYNTLMVDYLTGNSSRRLSGIGILMTHKTFITTAPIFGGSKSFYAYLKRDTIIDALRTSYLYYRAEMMKFDNFTLNGSRLQISDLLGFESNEPIIPKDIIAKYTVEVSNNVHDIVNRLDFLDEVFKEYIVEYIDTRIELLRNFVYI